jgi:hypothetical protein
MVPTGMNCSGIVLPGFTSTAFFPSDDLVADSKALRSEDVGLLAVCVLDERDERGAVRIVFDPLDRAGTRNLRRLKSIRR